MSEGQGPPLAGSLTRKRGLAMKQPSPDTQEMLESLRECVSRELERKRRLGHYAVIWQNASEVPRRLPNLKSCWQLCWQPCDYFRESESVSQQCPRRTGPLHL